MRVSAVIPAFNVKDTIGRAVKSALEQTFALHELIVVDDASTDGTRDILQAMAAQDSRIKLISLRNNGGPALARNLGLDAVSGSAVALLDGDDAWKPDRLERLCSVMMQQGADFVADNLVLYDSGHQREVRLAYQAKAPLFALDARTYFQQNIFTGGFTFALLKPIMRTEFLQSHAIRYAEELRYGEDLVFMGKQLLAGAKAFLTSDGYYLYTTRVGEISGQRSPHSRSQPDFISVIAELEKLQHQADALTAREIRRCIESFRVVDKANAARSLRQRGRYAGYVRALTDIDIVKLMAQQRLRKFMARLKRI